MNVLRGRPLLRHLLNEQWFLLGAVWACYQVVVLGFTFGIAAWRGIDDSVWEQSSQISRYFAALIGIYLTGTALRLAIVHGRTRREFLAQAGVFAVVHSATFALLCTLSFAVETLVYRIGGWPQTLTGQHLYSSPTQYAHIFVTFWLTLAVWLVAGAFVAAAFYRDAGLGILTIPVGFAVITPTELVAGFNPVPILHLILPVRDYSATVGVVLCLAGLAVALALNWALIRQIPVRSRPA